MQKNLTIKFSMQFAYGVLFLLKHPWPRLTSGALSQVLIVCGGSYRRGKASCGDMDIVITHPDGKRFSVKELWIY